MVSVAVYGQLPATDIYMLTMLKNGDKISLKDPVYISGFNPDGYNNQPHFASPTQLYITTNMYDDTFTDFVRLDLQDERYFRVTATDSISEYSPTPQAPNDHFSAVRVEKDGRTQSLWLYPDDHSNYGNRVLSDLSNVGYHCWLSNELVALFLVDEPMTLGIGNIAKSTTQIVLENIGRCFRTDTDGNLIFVHKVSESSWYLKKYDLKNQRATTICQTVPTSEDFEVLSDGTLIMGSGSKLYAMNPKNQSGWSEISDLSVYDIFDISRIAISRNRLVIVNTPTK